MPNHKSISYPTIYEAIIGCEKVEVIIDNKTTHIDNDSDEYTQIFSELDNMLKNSHEMPAFGVSLDNEVKEATKNGVWLKLIYSSTITYNDMTFDTLLIEVQKEWGGFNIHRGNNEVYEGRCYYISLENNMNKLYDCLINNIQN